MAWPLYYENYLVFSLFLALFMIEIGIALVSLFDYEEYQKKLKGYLLSLWAINGTFGILYIVSFEATYPGLLTQVGNAYIAPALLAALFFVARNAFIAYSEMIGRNIEERRFSRIYAVSTLVVGFLLVSVLSSGISGIGVTAGQADIAQVLVNPFGILMFMAIAMMALAFVSFQFSLEKMRRASGFVLLASIVVVYLSAYFWFPYLVADGVAVFWALAVAALFLIMLFVAFAIRSRYSKYAALPTLVLLINLFGMLQYPFVFGGSVNINNALVNSTAAPYVAIITGICLVFLSLTLGFMFAISRRRSD